MRTTRYSPTCKQVYSFNEDNTIGNIYYCSDDLIIGLISIRIINGVKVSYELDPYGISIRHFFSDYYYLAMYDNKFQPESNLELHSLGQIFEVLRHYPNMDKLLFM